MTSKTPYPDQAAPVPGEVRENLFVVVPAYNEGPCLANVVGELREHYPHVVVVDDGSSDNTFEVATRGATYVLRHVINRGQGAAIQTGVEFALRHGAQFIVTFDADGQHRVEDIPAVLEPIWRGDCEIVLGSRFLGAAEDIPPMRRLTLKAAVLFTRVVNRVELTDAHNGFRAFSRRAAEHIHITLDRMAHASELIDQIRRSGLPVHEVPVRVRYTPYSLAKGQSTRGALRIVLQYLLGRVFQ